MKSVFRIENKAMFVILKLTWLLKARRSKGLGWQQPWYYWSSSNALLWRHNEHDSVSNHQPRGCLLNRFIQTPIKENIKAPRHWPLCGEFTGTGEFPTQRSSYAEKVSIWWRHHAEYSGLKTRKVNLICSFTLLYRYRLLKPVWTRVWWGL